MYCDRNVMENRLCRAFCVMCSEARGGVVAGRGEHFCWDPEVRAIALSRPAVLESLQGWPFCSVAGMAL